MARRSVGDLSAGNRALVVRDRPRPSRALDPIAWSERTPISGKRMVVAGLTMFALGIAGAALLPAGIIGAPIWGGLLTMGGGLVFLGARKAGQRPMPEPRALSASERSVIEERSRRIAALLAGGGRSQGDHTFERIVADLGWTNEAVLSALLHMKETGSIIEDLNLDTGQWVYRLQDPDLADPGSQPLMLDERKAEYEDSPSDR